MAYGKTINEIRSEYAPYDKMPAFDQGFQDYRAGLAFEHCGVAGQAYDRGQECAMRFQRQENWERDNVGPN